MTDFGAWTLLPPGLAILFAMVTRRVYQSLLLGILVAGFMVAGDRAFTEHGALLAVPAAIAGGFMQSVRWIVLGLADGGHAGVVAFTVFLGALVAVMQRSGAIKGFGEAAMRYASSRRRGQAAAWLLGAGFLAIDDYFHVIAAGSIFRPLTDRLRISREKLSYIIDSTAAPMVILVPISTWVGFILGVVAPVFAAEQVTETPFSVFLKGIPFNFYAILTVSFVGVVALTRVEFGPMRKAERRAVEEGKLLRDGAQPLMSRELSEMEPAQGARPAAWNLILPVVFLFVTAITMLYATGYDGNDPTRDSFREAMQNSSAELSLAIASFLTLLFAMVLYAFRGTLKQDDFVETVLEGFKAMIPALAILALAWAIGNAVGPTQDALASHAMATGGAAPDANTGGVGLGDWLADSVADNLDVAAVPLIAFVLSGIIAFATGTSFGTFAIMLPITLGLTIPDPDATQWYGPVLAATVGGAVFGDHCSPISDTTVMSSMAGNCDHIDHVRTQLPYALTIAAIAALGYGVLALTGQAWVAWMVNLTVFGAVVGLAWLLSGPAPNLEAEA